MNDTTTSELAGADNMREIVRLQQIIQRERELSDALAARLKKAHDDDPDCKACKRAEYTGISCPDADALAQHAASRSEKV